MKNIKHYAILGLGITSCLFAMPSSACETLTERQEIGKLISLIEVSKMTFIRNGSSYDGAAAGKHLEDKLHAADGRVTTAEQFIRFIASASSITGQPYHVRFSDGKEMESGTWLTQQLSNIESEECHDDAKEGAAKD